MDNAVREYNPKRSVSLAMDVRMFTIEKEKRYPNIKYSGFSENVFGKMVHVLGSISPRQLPQKTLQ